MKTLLIAALLMLGACSKQEWESPQVIEVPIIEQVKARETYYKANGIVDMPTWVKDNNIGPISGPLR